MLKGWYVSYRAGAGTVMSLAKNRDEAITIACDLLDRKIDIQEKRNARAGRRLGYRRSFSRGKSTARASGRHPSADDIVGGARDTPRPLDARRALPAPMRRIGASRFCEPTPRTAFAMNWNGRVIGAKLATLRGEGMLHSA